MLSKARSSESDRTEKKLVWKKIPRSLARSKDWQIIKSRWLGINEGDEENTNCRSRFVGKGFNDWEIEGLSAATPPLEALRLLLSWAATGGTAPQGNATPNGDRSIQIADASRAFFEAPARRGFVLNSLKKRWPKEKPHRKWLGARGELIRNA